MYKRQEHGEHLGDGGEVREEHHVHDGMAVEPEDVLVADVPHVGREHRGIGAAHGEQGERGEQRREGADHHQAGGDHRPAEQGQPQHGHAAGAAAQDRPQHRPALEDGAGDGEEHTDDPQVGAGARRMLAVGQRRVGEPAVGVRADRGGEAGEHGQGAEDVEPVAEQGQAGQRDAGGADLQRYQVDAHADGEGGHDHVDHAGAVDREELVVGVRSEERLLGLGELTAHEQGEHAVHQQEDQGGAGGEQADALVVGGGDPAEPAARRDGPAGVVPLCFGGGRDRHAGAVPPCAQRSYSCGGTALIQKSIVQCRCPQNSAHRPRQRPARSRVRVKVFTWCGKASIL